MPDIVRRNFRQYDRDNKQGGLVAPTAFHGTQLAVAVASRAYYLRVVPSRPMTIVSIKFVVTAFSATDDAVDVGIINGTTGARLVSSGATTGKVNTSNAVKSISITPTTLAANTVYYAGLAYGASAAPATFVQTAFSSFLAVGVLGSTLGTIEQFTNDSQATIPDPVTITGSGQSGEIKLWLSET